MKQSIRVFKAIRLDDIKKLYRKGLRDLEKVLFDVKGLYPVPDLKESGMSYRRL